MGNNIETIAGTSKSEGSILLPVRIFNITKDFPFFIIKSKSFKDDVLLGLDCIKEFKLCQDENLKIKRNNKINKIPYIKFSIDKPAMNNNIYKSNLNDILRKYDKAFAENKFDIGPVKGYEATIKLT